LGKDKGKKKGNNEVERVSGHVLCEKEEVRKRWKDYFSSLPQGE